MNYGNQLFHQYNLINMSCTNHLAYLDLQCSCKSEPFASPDENVVILILLDQQLLKLFSLLDHVTEMTCHLFKTVRFDFEEGN